MAAAPTASIHCDAPVGGGCLSVTVRPGPWKPLWRAANSSTLHRDVRAAGGAAVSAVPLAPFPPVFCAQNTVQMPQRHSQGLCSLSHLRTAPVVHRIRVSVCLSVCLSVCVCEFCAPPHCMCSDACMYAWICVCVCMCVCTDGMYICCVFVLCLCRVGAQRRGLCVSSALSVFEYVSSLASET